MNSYNLVELDDKEPPKGRDIKYLVGMLEKVLTEIEQTKNELINLNTPKPIFTKIEAAEYLRVSERTVSNLVSEGILVPYFIGEKTVRFKKKNLDECLKRREGDFWDPKQFKH